MEQANRPMIWIYQGSGGPEAAGLARALGERAQSLLLAPEGVACDLALGGQPDLGLALCTCPAEMRPAAAVWLDHGRGQPPVNFAGLPCPLFYAGPGPVPEWAAPLPRGSAAAEAVLAGAAAGWRPAWLPRVQVNLPLRDLLGHYRWLISRHPVNLEVGIDGMALDTLGPVDLSEAGGLLAGRRITCHLPFMDLSPASLDQGIARHSRDRLFKAAEWALELGAQNAVMHLGYLKPLHRDMDGFAARLAETVAPLARRLAKGGCTLALENVFEPGPEVYEAVAGAVVEKGARVGFCLDVGHALAFSRADIREWWARLGGQVLEMHLHDNAGQDDQHLPPGWGGVDWEFLGQALAELPSPPIFTLEPHNEPHLWAGLRGLELVWGAEGPGR